MESGTGTCCTHGQCLAGGASGALQPRLSRAVADAPPECSDALLCYCLRNDESKYARKSDCSASQMIDGLQPYFDGDGDGDGDGD
jgi:hypothetical protein